MNYKRIVITGIGMITSIGQNVKENWESILSGKSGITQITSFNTNNLKCKIGGYIHKFNPQHFLNHKEIKIMDKFMYLGFIAAQEAIQDAKIELINNKQIGVIIGSGMGSINTLEKHLINKTQHKHPYYIPSILMNTLSGYIAIKYGFTGPNYSISSACTTGTNAIISAIRTIQCGETNIVVTGAADAAITYTNIIGFSLIKVLSTQYNHIPEQSVKPWDKYRDGFIIGEGAGIIVIEEYQHAINRKSKIYAEIISYCNTCNAFHITQPELKNTINTINTSIFNAQIIPQQINYINGHGTATKIGDYIEAQAIKHIFKNHKTLSMSSTKPATGHLLGAAGSVEIIFTTLAIIHQIAPPTLNTTVPIINNINLILNKPEKVNIHYAMSNSFGFGGQSTSIILKKHV